MPLRRRPVALVLSVLLLAGLGVVGGTWLHDRSEARAEDRRIAAVQARLAPADAALKAVPLPAGWSPCTSGPRTTLCWTRSGTTAQKATPLLVDALRSAGATGLSARCVRKSAARTIVLCRVDGTLKGAVLDTLVTDMYGPLEVLAVAADQQPPDILKNGTPLPVG